MDITLKDVEVNTGYIVFECPTCGADVHVAEDDTHDIYWMIRQIHAYADRSDYIDRSGRCRVCGTKE